MVIVRNVVKTAVVGVLALCAADAMADWKGKGELGLVLAKGNTESTALNAKADMTTEVDQWKHLVGFSVLRASSRNNDTGLTDDTANRYELHGQSDYKLSSRSYALGALRYEHDEFSPYIYQAIAAVGYGYKFYDTDATKLSTEAGVGYRRTKDRVTDDTDGNAVFRGAVNFEHKLTATTVVYDKFLVEAGSSNKFFQNEAGVKVAMNASLALSVAHLIRHNTDVVKNPNGYPKNTDQLLTANLVFSF